MPRGTVLFCKPSGKSSFGFITPEDGTANVYFGGKTAFGKSIRKGDRVEFEYGNYKPGKGPSAAHLKIIDDDERRDVVETIYGADEYEHWSRIA